MARARIPLLKTRVPAADVRRVLPSYGWGPRPAKVADPFYSSAAWIELRDRVRRESGNMCQWPGCTHRGRWIDHKLERKDRPDLELVRENLWNLCSPHHGSKGAAEKRKREGRGGHPKSGERGV